MSIIRVSDGTTFEANPSQRLILALRDNEVDILHRCGGNARCTTCRVFVHVGEPDRMTRAELDKLTERGLINQVRLSCQVLCDRDMFVEPINTLANTGLDDRGTRPADRITPNPVWVNKPPQQ